MVMPWVNGVARGELDIARERRVAPFQRCSANRQSFSLVCRARTRWPPYRVRRFGRAALAKRYELSPVVAGSGVGAFFLM